MMDTLSSSGKWVSVLQSWLNLGNPRLATVGISGQSGKASNPGVSLLQTAVITKRLDTISIEFFKDDAVTYFSTTSHPPDPDPWITLPIVPNRARVESRFQRYHFQTSTYQAPAMQFDRFQVSQ